MVSTTQRRRAILRVALLLNMLLVLNLVCLAQPRENPPAPPSSDSNKPLTSSEREELLKLIRTLQERLDKLEAAQAPPAQPAATTADAAVSTVPVGTPAPVAAESPETA